MIKVNPKKTTKGFVTGLEIGILGGMDPIGNILEIMREKKRGDYKNGYTTAMALANRFQENNFSIDSSNVISYSVGVETGAIISIIPNFLIGPLYFVSGIIVDSLFAGYKSAGKISKSG